MDVEKLMRVSKSQWKAVVGEQDVTLLFDVNNEF